MEEVVVSLLLTINITTQDERLLAGSTTIYVLKITHGTHRPTALPTLGRSPLVRPSGGESGGGGGVGPVCLGDASRETRRILRRRSFYSAFFSSQSIHCTEYTSYSRTGRAPQSPRPCRRKSRTVFDRSRGNGCIFACQAFLLNENDAHPSLITSQVDQLYSRKA